LERQPDQGEQTIAGCDAGVIELAISMAVISMAVISHLPASKNQVDKCQVFSKLGHRMGASHFLLEILDVGFQLTRAAVVVGYEFES